MLALKRSRGSKYVIEKANQFGFVDVVKEALNKEALESNKNEHNILIGMHMKIIKE